MQNSAVTLKMNSAERTHREALSVSKDLKNNYLRLFEILIEVETKQIYLEFEIASFHLYCVELLELSPATAKDFVTVVRKSLEVPALAEAIRAGKVTISKARKICSVIDPQSAKEWITLASDCSCRIVERAVAMARPREAVQESLHYVSKDLLEFKTAVSEEWSEYLKRTKDLLSQQQCRSISSEEALLILMKDFCYENDPVKKAERAEAKKAKRLAKTIEAIATKLPLGTTKQSQALENMTSKAQELKTSSARTRYIPADVSHKVTLRDQAQCSFVNRNGVRCNSKRWLEIHHIKEFALGGDHSIDNLRTLCSAHHKITHVKKNLKCRALTKLVSSEIEV